MFIKSQWDWASHTRRCMQTSVYYTNYKKGQMERSVANLHNRKWDIRYVRMVWDFVVTIPADPKIVHTIQQGFSHTYKPTDEGVFEHDYNDPPLQGMI